MIRFLSQRCNFVGAQNSTDYKTFFTLHISILALQSSDPFVREFLLLPICLLLQWYFRYYYHINSANAVTQFKMHQYHRFIRSIHLLQG